MDEAGPGRHHIVLTGATGFIGQALQRALAAAGHTLTALVRPGSCNAANVQPGVQQATVALDDAAALRAALAQADYVIYCAGAVRGRSVSDFRPANVDGVHAVLAAAQRQGAAPGVLHVSSLAATRPHLSDYAATKRAGEEVVRGYAGDNYVIVRPPAVYGPGDREMRPLFDALRRGIAVVTGPPGQRLSLLHVDDLAAAVVAMLAHWDACRGAAFELDDGTPGGYGWNDIIAAATAGQRVLKVRTPRTLLRLVAGANLGLAAVFGYAPMLSPGKVRELSEPSWLCDNRAINAATGWLPLRDLRAGLRTIYG